MRTACCIVGISILLSVLPVGVLAAESSDLATERNIGIGYEGMFLGEFLQGVSARGWLGKLGLEGDLWQASVDVGPYDVDAWVLSGKVLYAPIVREHTKFYVGFEGGWATMDLGYGDDLDGTTFGPLFGAEYRFQELPELGFNWEVGYRWTSLSPSGYDEDFDLNGISITLGVHYYFR
jgi:hypothetical protein